ncbi:MAG: cell division protein ZapA [Deltaproteobacteria bacterium]|nr:MAG: cell division protein ZapA [Deltaproteobacteria bacterium]
MSAAHEITLMGREFRIRSDDDPAHVQALADYVNAKIDELSGGQGHVASQQVLLMTTLNLADELFKIRAEHERLTERIRSTSRTLLNRIGG